MRLLKLTLAGFKSFADKTEIAFDRPIVGIVGPNGCGKSNVVDAIKWVLGEQSAKSLRGGAMQDVIFNGSAARPPSGMAMVTLTFENPVEAALLEEIGSGGGVRSIPRKLPVNADIVEVTRKLFRDGTSDYEINGQRARLRDVKETFLDTGVGTDAYSVIEQGKVSRMLEANPKERRLIFEEAAGISRFKARKKEAQRKLEKTEQNLTLCRNRLEETGARLRSMKMQAARARSWQEYTATLKDLQLRFGLAEYHTLTSELDGLQGDLAEANALRAETGVELAAAEAELAEVESRRGEEAARLAGLEDERRGWQSRMEQARQKAGFAERQAEETRANTARDAEHAAEVEEHLERHARETESLGATVETLAATFARAEETLAGARETNQAAQEEADAARAGLEEANRAVIRLQREAQGHRSEERSLLRFDENMAGTRAKLEARLGDAEAQLEAAVSARDAAAAALNKATLALTREEAQLNEQKLRSEQLTGAQAELSAKLAEARDRRSVLSSRCSVLAEMEAKNEGVAETVKAILEGGAQARDFPFVRGMLANLIEADTAHAALVEAALGEHQQTLVADKFGDLLNAKAALEALAGRVSFVAVDEPGSAGASPATGTAGILPALASLPTVSTLVRAPDWLQPLVDRLLGRTLIVRDLDAAHMARLVMPKGLRFVTKDGQVLDADGRVQAGPLSLGNGLISRRSELAVLNVDLAAVEAQIAGDQAVLADISQQAAAAESARGETQRRLFEARTSAARQTSSLDGLQGQVTRLEKETPAASAELAQVVAQIGEAQSKREAHAADAEQLEVEATQAQELAGGLQEQIGMLVERAEVAREMVTQARLESAALVEKRDSAERALRQHAVAEADLRRQQSRLQDQLQSYESRLDELARGEAEAQAEAEEADGKLQDAITRCDIARAQNAEAEEAAGTLRDRAKNARQTASGAENAAHRLELRVGNLSVKSETVRERVHEQLGMNLEEKYRAALDFIQQRDNPLSISTTEDFAFEETEDWTPAADSEDVGSAGDSPAPGTADILSAADEAQAAGEAPADPEAGETPALPSWLDLLFENCENPFALDMAATKAEMEELQGKIQRLGSVNLDAIEEEKTLEGRNDELAVQVKDIEEAKLALETLIEQINVDSRGRFEKTFNEIQNNFAGNEGMFRRIFGGGKAELKLIPPDEVDENGDKVPAVNPDGTFDVLEAGIEIFAQPPGKRPAALSQLSGGEKTMTALALLMAIFGTRPSPYAILDEVDAALDEANVDRYVKILKSFLHTSHFIVITHRKPTMQGCDALYGITMQERGVSKRVKVNVEEVSAEGSDDVKLSQEATARQDAPADDASSHFELEHFEEPKPKKRSKAIEEAFAAVTQEEKETVADPASVAQEQPTEVGDAKPRQPGKTVEAAFAEVAGMEPVPVETSTTGDEGVRAPGFPDLSIKAKSDNRNKMAMLLFGRKE